MAFPALLVLVFCRGPRAARSCLVRTQHGRGLGHSRAALRWGELVVGTLERVQDASPDPASVPRECQRTQGVSTTDLVGRMLLVTKAHHSGHVSLGGDGGGIPEVPGLRTLLGGREHPICPVLASLWALGQQVLRPWG